MTPDELAAFAAEVKAAHAAVRDKGPGTPEWDAWFGDHHGIQGIKDRWTSRPHGRDAAPGDLDGWQLPGEWPHGGEFRCRRCDAVCSSEGHPYGCPRTPGTLEERIVLQALRRCYCGQALVVTPALFCPCCENTPPVAVPGGCRWCGSNLCRVNSRDDDAEADANRFVEARYPDIGDRWVHARCVDEYLISRGRIESVERRRAERQVPIGVTSP